MKRIVVDIDDILQLRQSGENVRRFFFGGEDTKQSVRESSVSMPVIQVTTVSLSGLQP